VEALLAGAGRRAFAVLDGYLKLSRLIVDALYWTVVAPFRGKGLRWQSTIRHMVLVGWNAVPIVVFITFLIGFIMALQTTAQMKTMGATSYLPALIAIGMTRELGPLMTAIVLSGRSGSAFAAEVGTMVVAEEVDALQSMGLNPVKFLVVPKVLAMLLMMPVLTLIADLAGIWGGWVVGHYDLGIPTWSYFVQSMEALVLRDVVTGEIKSVIFGLIIAAVGCYYGFQVRGGAEGVGHNTTATVVSSIFLVIVADGVFTLIFYITG